MRARTALERIRKTNLWDDWVAVIAAIAIGRAKIMRKLNLTEPKGKRYSTEFSRWLVENRLNDVRKTTRKACPDCSAHINEIQQWRKVVEAEDPDLLMRLIHPQTVWAHFKAATQQATTRTKPTVRAATNLQTLADLDDQEVAAYICEEKDGDESRRAIVRHILKRIDGGEEMVHIAHGRHRTLLQRRLQHELGMTPDEIAALVMLLQPVQDE